MKSAGEAQRLDILKEAGHVFRKYTTGETTDFWKPVFEEAFRQNGWFSADQLDFAFRAWAVALTEEHIKRWTKAYQPGKLANNLRAGIIMAGNIPMAGLHDLLSALIAGVPVVAKLSNQDKVLLPALFKLLAAEQPWLDDFVRFTTGTTGRCDAFIATGSSNSAKHFLEFFGKYPHIVRRHRNSAAVITGQESKDELKALGEDIFTYYGLGCRSISKVYVPVNYDPDQLFNALFGYSDVAGNKKYINNYDYYKAVYLLNNEQILDNGFMLYRYSETYTSPPATLFWESYHSNDELMNRLEADREQLQCVVSLQGKFPGTIPFGSAQHPELWDYADHVDTVKFLLGLKDPGHN